MPSHLGSYVLSHWKRLMNEVINHMDGFYSESIHYSDCDSINVHKNECNNLEKGVILKTGSVLVKMITVRKTVFSGVCF